MRLGAFLLAVGLIVFIAYTCVATAESHILEEGSVQKQGEEIESREEDNQRKPEGKDDEEERREDGSGEKGEVSEMGGGENDSEKNDISEPGDRAKGKKGKKCDKTKVKTGRCSKETQVELEIEGGLKACRYGGKSGNQIEISEGKIELKDKKTGDKWKVKVEAEGAEEKTGRETEQTEKTHEETVEVGREAEEQMTEVGAGEVSEATELTSEEASSEASSEEEKAVEERDVEEYMDHAQGGGFPQSCSKKYREELEKKLKAKYGAKWEVYYWTILVKDVDVHYSGSMSESERVELRKKYEAKYGVSWRIYYWRYISQNIEYSVDKMKIEELKKKYGKVWRLHYGGYGHWFGFKHGHHRHWLKNLTEKDFKMASVGQVLGSTEVYVTAGNGAYQKQVEMSKSEESKSLEERSVEVYMDHVGVGKSGVKYADSMSKEWRINLEKKLKSRYGGKWEIPYWVQLTANIDRYFRGTLSFADRAKLRWSLILKYGKEWRRYYWRVLAQNMESYLGGESVNRSKVRYNRFRRPHFGPFSRRFVHNWPGFRFRG